MKTQYLYVMGAGSGAGKSTICLGILVQLLASGFTEDQLAYIKPVTKCTEKQPVALFCEQKNISYRDLGCLVFNKGFSKDYIDGLTPDSTELMNQVLDSIHTVAQGKAVVIIDGIGDPASGSVVGISNVDVASNLACRVIFIGKPGIGAALDNTVLCVSFMQAKGLRDIGIIYNKIPFLAVTDIEKYVSKRLTELLPDVTLLGFIKNNEVLTNLPPEFTSFVLKKNSSPSTLSLERNKNSA
ncbi:MAG: dethiobiotin synthase [Methylobacter sp.]|nr:dethiobiotin synthase [Methylobacter sp.]